MREIRNVPARRQPAGYPQVVDRRAAVSREAKTPSLP